MFAAPHPEVLAAEWLPPSLVDRAAELEAVRGWLGDPIPSHGGPWAVAVRGPPGSGTSATARWAARRLVDGYRRERPSATPPVSIPLRVRWCRGTHGVASELLRRLDEGFSGRGFPVVEIVAGFLRRLARNGQPAVVVLDDLGPDTPDLAPILRGLLHPLRFLPEGVDAAPPIWVLVAGGLDRPGLAPAWERVGFPLAQSVAIPPMSRTTLRRILEDRATRALGRAPPAEWVDRWTRMAADRGLGSARAMDQLRIDLLGREAARPGTMFAARGSPSVLAVEPRVLRAIASLPRGTPVEVSDLRRGEAALARAEGSRPLPATTLWRRLVHLEAAGLVRREVRPGGPGGTRSRFELLRPVSDWPVPPGWDRTRPADGAPSLSGGRAPRGPAPLLGRSPAPAAPGGRPLPPTWGN